MSNITRAFTTRRAKRTFGLGSEGGDGTGHWSNTTMNHDSIRSKISAPVQLIHTTNMLSYDAPDLDPKSASSTNSSSKSDDGLSDTHTQHSSPPTSPEIALSLKTARAPEPNHLSCYFTIPGTEANKAHAEAPLTPKRAPTHTKKSTEGLAQKTLASQLSERSKGVVSSKASSVLSRSSPSSTSTVSTQHSQYSLVSSSRRMPKMSTTANRTQGAVKARPAPSSRPAQQTREMMSHPFGSELAKVTEIAEEYGVKDRLNTVDEEELYMASHGLRKLSATDYLMDIRFLHDSLFNDQPSATPRQLAAMQEGTAVWI